MGVVLLKIMSMIMVLIIGYVLKKIGFFKKDDYKLVAKIAINIALPAAIITSFQRFEKNNSLLFLIIIAMVFNSIFIFLGNILGKNKEDTLKSVYIISGSGYNIGSFSLPYLENLLGPFGVVATCLFDSGNAPFTLGGSHAIASHLMRENKKTHIKTIISKLMMSPSILTYLVMITLSFNSIKLPSSLIVFTSYVGGANSFLSMLMIGMMFEIEFKREYFKHAFTILGMRYIVASVSATAFYYLTSFSLEIRQMLVILMFAPISGLAPIFVDKLKGNVGLAGFISSISIVISTVIMSVLIILMGVSI